MSTGLETWNQSILDIGPAYPFVGTEFLLVIIGFASWIIWHVIQIRMENKTYDEEKKSFSDPKRLESAIKMSRRESLATRLDGHDL